MSSRTFLTAFHTLGFFLVASTLRLLEFLTGLDIQRHLSHPGTGLGKFVVTALFKRNEPGIKKMIDMVVPSKDEQHAPLQVVEVGFGPGASVEYLFSRNDDVRYAGFEISQSMMETCAARPAVAKLMEKGLVTLTQKDVAKEGIPLGKGSQDLVLHSNVIYFVDDPLAFTREICKVLKPNGGRLAFYMMSKQGVERVRRDRLDSPFKTALEDEEVRQMCLDAGFTKVELVRIFDMGERWIVVATRG